MILKFDSQPTQMKTGPIPVIATLKVSKESGLSGIGPDMLHNLLGVEVGTIDRMLDSADSAASLLGV